MDSVSFCIKAVLWNEDGKHDDGSDIMVRRVGKREFGETCKPLKGFTGARYTEEVVYTEGLSFDEPDTCKWTKLTNNTEI